jgi:hypothetical protein
MRYLWQDFKRWALKVVEPWREEQASLDLVWRTFAQRHNAAGRRPRCMYEGMENDLDPDEKATVYEFPGGDEAAPPDCLNEAYREAERQRVEQARVRDGLNYRPGKVPN